MQGDSELGRAVAMQQRAAVLGFDWPDARGPLAKVREETAELEREMRDARREMRDALKAELGDLLFAVVNLARKLEIDPDSALARANDKFERRFGAVQRLAQIRGIPLQGSSLEALDALWNEVKGGYGQSL